MRKVFLIFIYLIGWTHTNAENRDSTAVHIADVYYEVLGANQILSFNTEFFSQQ